MKSFFTACMCIALAASAVFSQTKISCGVTPAPTATASSIQNAGFPASYAVDCNTGTRWSSAASDPQWIYVDLQASKAISRVVLRWESASGKNYVIEGSNDATFATKTTLVTKTNMATGARTDDLTGLSGTYRYIRMYGTARTSGYGYSLYEFEVYDAASGQAPTITTQPTNATVTAPSTANFSVIASGTAPLSYQWRKNGTNISGATSASYTTPATTTSDNGAKFDVMVTNTYGTATSNQATLTVNAAPVGPSITAQPQDQTVNPLQTAMFCVTATGTAPLSYQWYKTPAPGYGNRAAISGATSSCYTTPAVTIADNGSKFDCVVTNAVGNAASTTALLTVNTAPTITVQPQNQTKDPGQTATFCVTAVGSNPISYQWYQTPSGGNRALISGATSSCYITSALTYADNGTKFDVIVANTVGSVPSNQATLTVTPPACTWNCNTDDVMWNHRAILVGPNCLTPGDQGLTLGGWFFNLRGEPGSQTGVDMAPGTATINDANGTTTITGGAVAAKSVNAENISTTANLNAGSAVITNGLTAGSSDIAGNLNAGSAAIAGNLSAGSTTLSTAYVSGGVTAGSAKLYGDLLAGGTATLANVNVTSSFNAGSADIANLNAGSLTVANNLDLNNATVNAGAITAGALTTVGPVTAGDINVPNGCIIVGQSRINIDNVRTAEVYTKTLHITQSPWSDFVFAKGYTLMPLAKIEQFIKKYGHLPDMPSEAEVKENGSDVGEVQAKLLQKVEELTLHAIALEKKVNALADENNSLKATISNLKVK